MKKFNGYKRKDLKKNFNDLIKEFVKETEEFASQIHC